MESTFKARLAPCEGGKKKEEEKKKGLPMRIQRDEGSCAQAF